MTIQELAQRFNISVRTIRWWRSQGVIPPPFGRTYTATYGLPHIEAIENYLALKHAFVSPMHAFHFCQEEGISPKQYLTNRLHAITDNAPGIA